MGLAPRAPGTWGTLAAIPLYLLTQPLLGDAGLLAAAIVAYLLGGWACDVTGRHLGMSDYGGMVWDETVAFFLVLIFTPQMWVWQAVAFGLFRFFDIVKPPPIGYYDRTLKSGWGVMFDDLIAAGYTLFALALLKAAVGDRWLDAASWMGLGG